MRRKDRETSREEALLILDHSPWGVLSAVDSNNEPYCIPLSLVRDGDWLYFHGAVEGQKIDILRARNKVCIAFVNNVEYPDDKFTTFYESAVVFGTAEELHDDEEKLHGLRLISERFMPDNMKAFDGEINKYFARTRVWKIHIDEITGKRNKKP
jgi:nitroimidazol reductase NimA-like FMN-containing flavoprotein (pyridoxamine 5'-phosphate oxidase superfamily)